MQMLDSYSPRQDRYTAAMRVLNIMDFHLPLLPPSLSLFPSFTAVEPAYVTHRVKCLLSVLSRSLCHTCLTEQGATGQWGSTAACPPSVWVAFCIVCPPSPPHPTSTLTHTCQMLGCQYKDTHARLHMHTNAYTQAVLHSSEQTALHTLSNTIINSPQQPHLFSQQGLCISLITDTWSYTPG